MWGMTHRLEASCGLMRLLGVNELNQLVKVNSVH